MLASTKFHIALFLVGLAAHAGAQEVIYPTKPEIREDYKHLAQAPIGTILFCEGNWNAEVDKMASVALECDTTASVRASIIEMDANGWEIKSQSLAPHVTSYAPNGVPGWKRILVQMRKVKQYKRFNAKFKTPSVYALPGEEPQKNN